MTTENLKQYAELKMQASAIEEKLSELKPLILQEMVESDVDKVPTTLGNFTIKKTKKWSYSGAVILLKEQLDEQKSIEEADGTATFTETQILEFRENKK